MDSRVTGSSHGISWQDATQSISFLTAACLLAAFSARRLPMSLAGARSMNVVQVFAALATVASLIFVYSGSVMMAAVQATRSPTSCAAAIIVCFVLYALQKVFLLGFFTEQIFTVYNSQADSPTTRRQSKWYRSSAALLFAFVAVGLSMLSGRTNKTTGEDVCHIGLQQHAAIVVVGLQGVLNLYFLIAFCLPLRSTWLKGARPMAVKCAVASAIALVTTSANIGSMIAGARAGWLCLTFCGIDVFINAIVLFCISTPPPSASNARRSSFVSHFGTALPAKGAVPGVGFDELAMISSPSATACGDQSLSPAEAGDWKWGKPGRSPYWEGGHSRDNTSSCAPSPGESWTPKTEQEARTSAAENQV